MTRLLLLVVAAVAAELLAWALAGGTGTTTFAWFRVAAHAGNGGLLAAALAGLLAGGTVALLRRRRAPPPEPLADGPFTVGLGLLVLAAVAVHLPWSGMAQAQPDSANYFVLAQAVARDPVGSLLHWKALAWDTAQGRFHHPFPLVPVTLGLAFRAMGEHPGAVSLVMGFFAVLVPVATALAGAAGGRPRAGLAAGLVVLGIPFVQAQGGWLLVDLALAGLVALAWAALLRLRGPGGWVLVLGIGALAAATKVSAPVFLLGPAAAVLLEGRPRRWFWGAAAAGLALLAVVHPPRLREEAETWLEAVAVMGVHLRPSLWVLALGVLAARDRLERVVIGGLLALPVLVLYAPPEHVARYALPLAPALALAATWRSAGRAPLTAGLLASGLVLGFLGYRPLVVHHQAENLRGAVARLEASGVTGIQVWADQPESGFGAGPLAALVDLYATVPVAVGEDLARAGPEKKRHWWEVWEPPPWHEAPLPEGSGALLCLFGAGPESFEAGPGAGRPHLETVSRYRLSSFLLPKEVAIYGAAGAADSAEDDKEDPSD